MQKGNKSISIRGKEMRKSETDVCQVN